MCRVPDPAKFLADMKDLVVEGGAFVLVSPFSVNSPQNPYSTRIATFFPKGHSLHLVGFKPWAVVLNLHPPLSSLELKSVYFGPMTLTRALPTLEVAP
jgi:hypothetical protein